MSINLAEPDFSGRFRDFFKDLTEVCDDQTALLRDISSIEQLRKLQLAEEIEQMFEIEANEVGDVKVVDGYRYILTDDGWIAM